MQKKNIDKNQNKTLSFLWGYPVVVPVEEQESIKVVVEEKK
jgi:hypothetical protein